MRLNVDRFLKSQILEPNPPLADHFAKNIVKSQVLATLLTKTALHANSCFRINEKLSLSPEFCSQKVSYFYEIKMRVKIRALKPPVFFTLGV